MHKPNKTPETLTCDSVLQSDIFFVVSMAPKMESALLLLFMALEASVSCNLSLWMLSLIWWLWICVLLTQNVTVVVTVMFPFCEALLIGLKATASDLGDREGLEKGGLAHRGGGGGGVVLILFKWVGVWCVVVVGNEWGCVICAWKQVKPLLI